MIIEFRIRESSFIKNTNIKIYYAEKLTTSIGDPPRLEKKWESVDGVIHATPEQAKESILKHIEERKVVAPKDIIHELPELTIHIKENPRDKGFNSLQEDFLRNNPEAARVLGYTLEDINNMSKDPRPDICNCCGNKMKPLNNPQYICKNPNCDNYIKIIIAE